MMTAHETEKERKKFSIVPQFSNNSVLEKKMSQLSNVSSVLEQPTTACWDLYETSPSVHAVLDETKTNGIS